MSVEALIKFNLYKTDSPRALNTVELMSLRYLITALYGIEA